MRVTSWILAATFIASTATATPPPRSPVMTQKGSVIWFPDMYEGWKVCSITRLAGSDRLELYVNPENVYQYAATSGVNYDGSAMEEKRYYEIIIDPKQMTGAATRPGWRNSFRVPRYMRDEFDAIVPAHDGEDAAVIEVYTDGTNYLVVITTRRDKAGADTIEVKQVSR